MDCNLTYDEHVTQLTSKCIGASFEAGCKAARIDYLKHSKSSFLMFTTALES